jgi:tRNA 2-thiocytidine biosynthesis protein TtcA
MDISDDEPRPLNCFRCSWHRRKALFQAAHRLGCRKLALGHHADDAAETALLNLFYHGRLETMEPRVSFFDGQVIVIRPLIHVEEKEMVRFARSCGFPTDLGCCPRGAESRRRRMKELLRAVERDMPKAKINLLRAAERYGAAASDLERTAAGATAPAGRPRQSD